MKNRLRSRCLYLLGTLLVFTFALAMSTEASVKQTSIQASGIPISWDAEKPYGTLLGYKVMAGPDADHLTLAAELPASTLSYVVPAEGGSRLYIKVLYSTKSNLTGNVDEGLAGILPEGKTLPSAVTGVTPDGWLRYALVSYVKWNRVESADGYEVIFRTVKGKKVKKETITSRVERASLSKVKNTMTYTVRVRGYTTLNKQKFYGPWSEKCYLFTSPELKSASRSGAAIKLVWTPVSGATGYDIYLSTRPDKGYKKVKTLKGGKKSSVTITKFRSKAISPKKKYYAYVETRKKVGKRTYKSGSKYYLTVA